MKSIDEALFAAAAHHLISLRRYDEAVQVLKAYSALNRGSGYVRDFVERLDECRDLMAMIFECSSESDSYDSPLQRLQKHIAVIDSSIMRKYRKRRKRIRTLYDYLKELQRRPALYLGRPSVELLRFDLPSFRDPKWPPISLPERPSFRGFQRWIDRRYPELQGGGSGWHQILIKRAGGDGQEALDLFFRELALFKKHANGGAKPKK